MMEKLVVRSDREYGTWGFKRPSHLTQTPTDLIKTWCIRIF
jgi:hypothetical protein